jgi:sugar-phosphatase
MKKGLAQKAVIFDMDGLIINSEPFWQEAEKIVFKTVGITLTTEMCESTMGYRVDEVVKKWFHLFPWKNKTLLVVEKEIVEGVKNLINEKGEAMPGFHSLIELLKNNNLRFSLASSSKLDVITCVLDKLKVKDLFTSIHSAEHEQYGKPHPAIYLTTASHLKIDPADCLVLEDSFNGLIAAKAAKMKTIAIPFEKDFSNTRFDFSDFKVKSLQDIDQDLLEKAFSPLQ